MTELPNHRPAEPDRPRPAGPETMRPETPNIVYMPAKGNGPATSALVFGVIASIFGLVPLGFLVAAPAAIAALMCAIIGRRRARDPRAGGRPRATWGLILGLVGLGLSIVGAAIVTDGFLDFDRSITREVRQEMGQLEEDYESVVP